MDKDRFEFIEVGRDRELDRRHFGNASENPSALVWILDRDALCSKDWTTSNPNDTLGNAPDMILHLMGLALISNHD